MLAKASFDLAQVARTPGLALELALPVTVRGAPAVLKAIVRAPFLGDLGLGIAPASGAGSGSEPPPGTDTPSPAPVSRARLVKEAILAGVEPRAAAESATPDSEESANAGCDDEVRRAETERPEREAQRLAEEKRDAEPEVEGFRHANPAGLALKATPQRVLSLTPSDAGSARSSWGSPASLTQLSFCELATRISSATESELEQFGLYQATVEELEDLLEEAEALLDQTQGELALVQAEKAGLDAALGALREEHRALRAEVEDAGASRASREGADEEDDGEEEEASVDAAGRTAELERALAAAQALAAGREEVIRAQEGRMVELEAMVQEAEKKVGLKATLEAGVLELKEKLFGALGDLEAHNEKLEALHRRERQQNVNYKTALEAAMARISTLQHDLAKVRKLSMEREEKLAAQEGRINELKNDLEAARAAIHGLEAERDALRAEAKAAAAPPPPAAAAESDVGKLMEEKVLLQQENEALLEDVTSTKILLANLMMDLQKQKSPLAKKYNSSSHGSPPRKGR